MYACEEREGEGWRFSRRIQRPRGEFGMNVFYRLRSRRDLEDVGGDQGPECGRDLLRPAGGPRFASERRLVISDLNFRFHPISSSCSFVHARVNLYCGTFFFSPGPPTRAAVLGSGLPFFTWNILAQRSVEPVCFQQVLCWYVIRRHSGSVYLAFPTQSFKDVYDGVRVEALPGKSNKRKRGKRTTADGPNHPGSLHKILQGVVDTVTPLCPLLSIPTLADWSWAIVGSTASEKQMKRFAYLGDSVMAACLSILLLETIPEGTSSLFAVRI